MNALAPFSPDSSASSAANTSECSGLSALTPRRDREQGGDARRVVVGAVENLAVAHAQMIEVSREDDEAPRLATAADDADDVDAVAVARIAPAAKRERPLVGRRRWAEFRPP